MIIKKARVGPNFEKLNGWKSLQKSIIKVELEKLVTRDKFWRKHVHNIAREKVIFGGQSQGLEISRHAPRIDKERKFPSRVAL